MCFLEALLRLPLELWTIVSLKINDSVNEMKEIRENKPLKLFWNFFLLPSDDKFLVLNMINIYGAIVSNFTLCSIVGYNHSQCVPYHRTKCCKAHGCIYWLLSSLTWLIKLLKYCHIIFYYTVFPDVLALAWMIMAYFMSQCKLS